MLSIIRSCGVVIEMGREDSAGELRGLAVDYFVSFVQMFGLSKSVGQIYGTLFVSPAPLSMDEIVACARISKGSVSQGLRLLKTLGAVAVRQTEGDRRDRYVADVNLSRIVTHFFENRVQTHLARSEARIEQMLALSADVAQVEDDRQIIARRIEALQKWQERGTRTLPLVVAWLER